MRAEAKQRPTRLRWTQSRLLAAAPDARSGCQLRAECRAKNKMTAAQTVAMATMVPVAGLYFEPSPNKRSDMGLPPRPCHPAHVLVAPAAHPVLLGGQKNSRAKREPRLRRRHP